MGSWLGLRKKIKERFAGDLEKRLDLHYTVYNSKDRRTVRGGAPWRLWFALDGEEIFTVDSFTAGALLVTSESEPDGTSGIDIDAVMDALKLYLNESVEDLLNSPQPLLRALALVDKRLGKRRLQEISVDEEPPIVKELYAARLKSV